MRIVSLVPSLTKTLFDLGLTADSIVGRTPWCIHPAGEVNAVPVVGGTKTPTLSKIINAQPDLVVLDRDENPKSVYDWCQEQGLATFVCHVSHPADVPAMLRSLGTVVNKSEEAEAMAQTIERTLNDLPAPNGRCALPMIWHEPLMAANGATYAGNMVACMGYHVPVIQPDGTGYPVVSARDLMEHGVTDLFLSSEPHEFSLAEGQAMAQAVVEAGGVAPRIHLIDGEDLTWMGSHTAQGLRAMVERSQAPGAGTSADR